MKDNNIEGNIGYVADKLASIPLAKEAESVLSSNWPSPSASPPKSRQDSVSATSINESVRASTSLFALKSRSRSASTTKQSYTALPPILPAKPKKAVTIAPIDLAGVSSKLEHSVFVSYCWLNSRSALELGQVNPETCNIGGCDPRDLAGRLTADGIISFLDVNRFREGQDLDEEMKRNIKSAKLGLICISEEYMKSPNCWLEFELITRNGPNYSPNYQIIVVGAKGGFHFDDKHKNLVGNHYWIDTTQDKVGFSSGKYLNIKECVESKLHIVTETPAETPAAMRADQPKTIQEQARCGNSNALYLEGCNLLDRGQATEGLEKLEYAADLGHMDAKYILGKLYREGSETEGVEKDAVKAIKWLEDLAKEGDFRAQLELAEMYHDGDGIKLDFEKAIHFAELAASQKCSGALQLLGDIYLNGRGTTKDTTHGLRMVGWMYQQGLGTGQNSKLAKQFYVRASKKGCKTSQWHIGLMLYVGDRMNQDVIKGIAWLVKAGAGYEGIIEAQLSLGEIYKNGYGIQKSAVEAFRWYLAAAENGSETAQHTISLMYQYGEGVEKSSEKAKQWLHRMFQHQMLDDKELSPNITDSLADLGSTDSI
ncbi:hypothetical protein BDR26DRAFT_920967 [Obelidium mucronatum]|nr:hypothetical protein BDR26DRAFT_920967 [Obelidium mucronatum]